MPRIDAPTVAEHRARQRRALIDAARELLAEGGRVPSMASVGRRAGLARTSVYQYFSSPRELMSEVVATVFPDWAREVTDRVEAAASPSGRVWAYIEANITLFASPEQKLAHVLARVVEPSVLEGPMREYHAQLQTALREALAELGEPDPEAMAQTINAIIRSGAGRFEAADGDADADAATSEALRNQILDQLRRLLGGYLKLPAS